MDTKVPKVVDTAHKAVAAVAAICITVNNLTVNLFLAAAVAAAVAFFWAMVLAELVRRAVTKVQVLLPAIREPPAQ